MRHVGTTAEVVSAFLAGEPLRTTSAVVPGGCRIRSVVRPDDGLTVLYSYATEVAYRYADGRVALTSRRYSNATSRLMRSVRAGLHHLGYRWLGGETTIRATVPGRWGGWGPAWAPSPVSTEVALVYEAVAA